MCVYTHINKYYMYTHTYIVRILRQGNRRCGKHTERRKRPKNKTELRQQKYLQVGK